MDSVADAATREPAWFEMLPADLRPALPLREGFRFGTAEGEYVHEKTGIVFVWIPPGTLSMGQDGLAGPVHQVRFAKGFWLAKHEVTNAQFKGAAGQDAQHPVVNVSWEEARAFCQKNGLRLPSEAEWEYAARGTDGRTYPWGNQEPDATRCNLDGAGDGFAHTAPVGSFPSGASPFGALDLAGNVWEWVADGYQDSYQGAPADGTARSTAGASDRVRRGGSWSYDARFCRAAYRVWSVPLDRNDSLGFRPASDP